MTGQTIKKVLLTEAVYTKAPSMLTSALLAEPSEDEANARHLDIIFHGKFTDACKTSIQVRGQCVLFVFEMKFIATKSSQGSLNLAWSSETHKNQDSGMCGSPGRKPGENVPSFREGSF